MTQPDHHQPSCFSPVARILLHALRGPLTAIDGLRQLVLIMDSNIRQNSPYVNQYARAFATFFGLG